MKLTTSDGVVLPAIVLPNRMIKALAYDPAGERVVVRFAEAEAEFAAVDVGLWERIRQATDRAAALKRLVLAHPRRHGRTELTAAVREAAQPTSK